MPKKTVWNKGLTYKLSDIDKSEEFSNAKIFVQNSTHPRHRIKERIIKQQLLPYLCAICLVTEWQGKKIMLVLDHINGICNDNRLSNLRFVCSNCDAQLPTYKSRNRKSKSR
jgi:hypothetical protein